MKPDAALVHAARGGDKDAVGGLIIRHRAMAVALVTRLLGSSDEAADIVQEAAVTALVGLDRLRSPERFGAWFAGIALNVGRRWLRDSLVAGAALSFADMPDECQGPEDEAVSAVLAQRVRAQWMRSPLASVRPSSPSTGRGSRTRRPPRARCPARRGEGSTPQGARRPGAGLGGPTRSVERTRKEDACHGEQR